MKKKIILLFLAVISLTTLQSWKLEKNLTVSVGFMKTSIHGGESWKDPFGVQIGVSSEVVKFNETMSLVPEINFSMQGAAYEETSGIEGKLNLQYLNIPIAFRYQSKSGAFGEAGVQAGFLLCAKDKYNGESYDYRGSMNKVDFSIPIEVGYKFKNDFGVGIRVVTGLTDITDDDSSAGDEADRNFLFGVRASYTFGK